MSIELRTLMLRHACDTIQHLHSAFCVPSTSVGYLYALTPNTTMEDKYCYNFILQRRTWKLGEVNLASVMQIVSVRGFAVCPMALKHLCYSTS